MKSFVNEGQFAKEQCPWNKGKKGVQVGWNKGLTKETDDRVRNNGLSVHKARFREHQLEWCYNFCGRILVKKNGRWPKSFCCRSCASSFTMKLYKHKVDCVCASCRVKNGESFVLGKHWNLSQETRDKQSASAAGVPKSLAHRQATSDGMRRRWEDPVFQEKVGFASAGKHSGYYSSSKMGKRIFYQSSYEKKACEILEEDPSVVTYERCKDSIPYVDQESRRNYHPDYFVIYQDGSRCILEVKASWNLRDPKRRKLFFAKMIAAIQFCMLDSYEYKVWMEKDLGS